MKGTEVSGSKKEIRTFPLTHLALGNRTVVFLISLMIILFGINSYMTLPKESFPDISLNKIYVGVPYSGNSPVDIENLITRPIEKELNSISEVVEINSVSVQDYATLIIDFPPEMDIEVALSKVKDAVDLAKRELPTDMRQDPNVFEFDFGSLPILNVNLSGDYSVAQLEIFAEELKILIEKIPEITDVKIRNTEEKELEILLNPHKMDATQVSFSDVETAIFSENITMSGGHIMEDGRLRRSLRVVGEIKDPAELEYLVVRSEKGDVIHLGDVASIKFGYRDEKSSYARLNGLPAVTVDAIKGTGENLIIATDRVMSAIREAQEDFPDDLSISITNDQSDETRKMISGLENNIIFGVILVVLVLQFFLNTRNALFVGISIPMSMFLSFCILSFSGMTINMMVLFSLIMALGMLVDNGIVVVENCFRLMEEGMSRWDATRKGVREVAVPIISSTLTTLGAFFPLVLWPGMMGEFMRFLPLTLIITLGSSLVVALVINPVVISLLMQGDDRKGMDLRRLYRIFFILIGIGIVFLFLDQFVLGNLCFVIGLFLLLNTHVLEPFSVLFKNRFLPLLEGFYVALLERALRGRGPYSFFVGTIFLFILSFILLGIFTPKTLFFPESEPKYLNVFIEKPIGTDIEETNEFCQEIEGEIIDFMKPYNYMVNSITSKVGLGATDPNDIEAASPGETPHKALITVDFKDSKFRKDQSTRDIMEEVRVILQDYAGASIWVEQNRNGPPVGKAISIEITGDDFEVLNDIASGMRDHILNAGIGGIEGLQTDLDVNKPSLLIHIDREKARRFGLSARRIAEEIRTSLFGKEVSKFKEGEDDHPIYLRLDSRYRHNLQSVLNKEIIFRNQSTGKLMGVPISSVARIERSSTYHTIRRRNLERVAHLESNVLGGFNPTEVNQEIASALNSFSLPRGYKFRFSGEQEKQAEEMAFLSRALWIAIFIILTVMVTQFNRVLPPLIIMTTVLFSLIGVLLGLVIFQMDFIIIMSMIGIISLAGIVVNNAIVLLDFIRVMKVRRRADLSEVDLSMDEIAKIIIMAGRTRLRPVLLTSVTTILGLLPLALGLNIDFIGFFENYDLDAHLGGDTTAFWGPIAWTITFGLSFSTFLTLVMIPVMYWLSERLSKPILRWIRS
ncbi:MAG: efflux RND transporter permease subunit [Cytophagales bacterium]|nr:efflux RND transporter permease subunit [Cytophagales bacterium]